MQLKAFNKKGIAAFTEYLDALRLDPARPVPTDLLDKPTLTRPLDEPIEATAQVFATRMDFACWLHDAADESNATVPLKDAGFWAWLTLALFDQVCPANAKGQRKANELSWYVPQFDDSRRRYRHVLAGIYSVLSLYEDDPYKAILFLSNKLQVLGHTWYQIASRQELISNPAIVEAATSLYFDEKKQRLKTGASSKRPGSLFRFVKLLNQLDRV